jgi:predicted dehydrogenase
MTNLGAHHLDIVDWVLGLDRLRSVISLGGRNVVHDGGETPDTQDALFDCGDYTIVWALREASRGEVQPFGLNFFGTHGQLGLSRAGFRLTPDADLPADHLIPGIGEHPVGGPTKTARAPSATPSLRTAPLEDMTGDANEQYRLHARDFLDCVKSRRAPISDLPSSHRTATACHLANLSLRLGRQLRWDAAKEEIIHDAEANAHLVRPYRAPWDAQLNALGVT